MRLVTAIFCLLAAAAIASAAPIHDAAAKGDLAAVKKQIASQPSLIKAVDKDGATPLHYAAVKGDVGVIRFLLGKKADVMARKKDGVTPLHVASALGRKNAVEALLQAKADPNAKDKKGRTPLSLAQANGFIDIQQMLQNGAAPARTAIKPKPQVATPPAASPTPVPAPDGKRDVVALGKEFVELITKGDYTTASEKLDATMKRALPPERLAKTWQGLTTKLGAFDSLGEARVEKARGFDVVHVKCRFEKATYDAQVSFDNAGLINGFYILNPDRMPKPSP